MAAAPSHAAAKLFEERLRASANSNLMEPRQEPFSLGEKVAVDAEHRFAKTAG